ALSVRDRITSIRAAHLTNQALAAANGVLRGGELAFFAYPQIVDNYEGIALRHLNGKRMIYLISDNNFNFRQRNLLLAFEWPPECPVNNGLALSAFNAKPLPAATTPPA